MDTKCSIEPDWLTLCDPVELVFLCEQQGLPASYLDITLSAHFMNNYEIFYNAFNWLVSLVA